MLNDIVLMLSCVNLLGIITRIIIKIQNKIRLLESFRVTFRANSDSS